MKKSRWAAVALHFTTSCLLLAALCISLSADLKLWAFILGLSAGLLKELTELIRAWRGVMNAQSNKGGKPCD